MGNTKLGKGMKLELAVDGRGRPLAVVTAPANVAETNLAGPALAEVELELPRGTSVLADRGYDSDPLRQRLAARGLRLIAAHRRDRTKSRTNDGRRLRRLRRRWVVERTIGWLKQFRRLNVRWEYYSAIFHGFVQLACLAIASRRF